MKWSFKYLPDNAVLQAVTNLVLMGSEKHILQLKFLQKLPIDNQKIKKKE